jgi:hypothetical protein
LAHARLQIFAFASSTTNVVRRQDDNRKTRRATVVLEFLYDGSALVWAFVKDHGMQAGAFD